jgi:hypothetical protein
MYNLWITFWLWITENRIKLSTGYPQWQKNNRAEVIHRVIHIESGQKNCKR